MRRSVLFGVAVLLGCNDLPARHHPNVSENGQPTTTAATTATSAPPPVTPTPSQPGELTLEAAPKAKHRDILRIQPRKHVLSGTESLMPMKKAIPGPRLVYLNRKGGTFTHGPDDSIKQTTSVFDKTGTVPPYEKGDAAWNTVLACTKAQLARWNIEITDDDPGTKPHIEMVVGGHPSVAGLDDTVGGIAPMLDDCGVNDGAIGFVFTKIFAKDEQEQECEVVAHELGHILGLDHAYHCPDNMTYLEGCGAKHFVDQAVPCGEDKARACACGATQNSVAVIDQNIGLATTLSPPSTTPGPTSLPPMPTSIPTTLPTAIPTTPAPPASTSASTPPAKPPTKKGDGKAPKVDMIAPADGTTLPNGASVALVARITDKDGIAKVFLRWRVGDNLSEIDCDTPSQGVTCTNLAGTYLFRLPAGQGPRKWSVRAVDKVGSETTSAERALTLQGEGATPPLVLPPGIKLPPFADVPAPAADLSATFVSPADNTMVHFGASIPVTVTVKGPADSVQVVWRSTFGDEIQPLKKGANGTWTGKLTVPKFALPGPRILRATAKTANGASVEAPFRTVTILP